VATNPSQKIIVNSNIMHHIRKVISAIQKIIINKEGISYEDITPKRHTPYKNSSNSDTYTKK